MMALRRTSLPSSNRVAREILSITSKIESVTCVTVGRSNLFSESEHRPLRHNPSVNRCAKLAHSHAIARRWPSLAPNSRPARFPSTWVRADLYPPPRPWRHGMTSIRGSDFGHAKIFVFFLLGKEKHM